MLKIQSSTGRKRQSSADGARTRPPQAKSAGGGKPASKAGGKRAGRRFVAPVRLDGAAREAIMATLDAAGIGDASGREIFVGALGYDLANLLQALGTGSRVGRSAATEVQAAAAAEGPGTAASASAGAATDTKAIGALADAARSLQQRLSALDDGGRKRLASALTRTDRLARDHGPGYLSALDAELMHLVTAANEACKTTGPARAGDASKSRRRSTPVKRPPAAEAATLAFVRQVARVYSQCLDQPPTAVADAPFARVLQIIADQAEVPLTLTPTVLRQGLADASETSRR